MRQVAADVARRISGRGMRMIDTSSPNLARFFRAE